MAYYVDGAFKDAIQKQAEIVGQKLLDGNFCDFTGAMVLVQRRKGLLEAITIMNELAKKGEADDGDQDS